VSGERLRKGREDAVMEIQSLEPRYGDNYNAGYNGFSFNDESIVSKGIAYLTRWTRMSEIRVSHALVVAGDESASRRKWKGRGGAVARHLFRRSHDHLFFRKPWGIRRTSAVGSRRRRKSRSARDTTNG
jgi:hypothetical protein